MKKVIALLFVLSLLLLSSCVDDSLSYYIRNSSGVSSTENISSNQMVSSEIGKTVITLVAGEMGEYGKMITFNKGTDGEVSRCAYFIPAGTYTVTNKGKYMSQLNVYSQKVNVTEEGWEEPADGVAELLDVGDATSVTINEGYYVYISEPSVFEFVMN